MCLLIAALLLSAPQQSFGQTPPIAPEASSPQQPGSEFQVDVRVGSESNAVENLNQIGFDFDFEQQHLNHVSDQEGSFLGNVQYASNVDAGNGIVEIGMTRTDDEGRSGSGVVAQVTLAVEGDVADGTELTFSIQNVQTEDPANNPIDLAPQDLTVEAKSQHQVTITGTDGTGDPDDKGWRLLASPSDATRGDLEDDLSFSVDSGNLLHTWAGGSASAWSPATSSSASLPRGKGFILYFFDDSTDPVTSSGLTLNVPFGGENQRSDAPVAGLDQSQRFHLLGNPYDVAFDLGNLAGGDLSGKGFQNTVQIWDPSGSGQWTTVTQGEAGGNLAAWQGFFIERQETGSGQTSLTFDAGRRQSGPGDLVGNKSQPLATTEEQAQVELALAVESDANTIAQGGVTLFLHDEASVGWDAYEASQLSPPNSEVYATANSPLQRDDDLIRRAQASEPFPTGDASTTVPLSVRSVGAAGTATLRWPESARDALPSEWDVQLIDTATGTTADLRDGSYSFELEDGDGTISDPDDARFDLHVGPATAVPVEMAGLEASVVGGPEDPEDKAVRLTWQTASEQNNAGFYVQRRPGNDGDWQRLGFVESKAAGGTTSEPQSYRFQDTSLPYAADTLTYRLRQVDTDGTAHRTDAVSLALGAPGQLDLEAPVPNPASERATLRFAVPEGLQAEEVRIGVYDLLGRQVATVADGRREAGRHEQQMDLSGMPSGTYFLRLRVGDEVQSQKLTVLR
jgi:hypothetical protein